MTFDPMSVEVTCVTLPKDHCVQVPWQYINVCGYSDQFRKLPHTYTYYIHTTYILHTTYRMSDHIVSYWTQFRRDKNCYISWNLCSMSKMWNILHCDTVKFTPCHCLIFVTYSPLYCVGLFCSPHQVDLPCLFLSPENNVSVHIALSWKLRNFSDKDDIQLEIQVPPSRSSTRRGQLRPKK